MKKTLLLFFIVLVASRMAAQEKRFHDSVMVYYANSDLVYDIESIPKVGYEKFFEGKKRLQSWQIDLAYQVHYSDEFGVVASHGDRISIGVYQGPAARFGYNIYSCRHNKKNWKNYCSPAVCMKYLWYGQEQVNTGKRMSPAYRIQTENCIAAVPQFVIGSKHTHKNFCADFYAGLQFPVKFRNRTIDFEQNSQGIENTRVPYNSDIVTFMPAPVIGIKLGFVKWKEKKTVG